MDYVIIAVVALVAAGLTLFSGFGLGTVLMPAFAIFFPVPVAVAATAIVHLANNLFKLALVGRHSNRTVALRFGVPAGLAAVLGAALLHWFEAASPLARFQLGGRAHEITLLKLVIAALIIVFALFELIPKLRDLSFSQKHLVFGSALSGFFGGLSGNQGALRSAFLVKCGLTKEQFIGTGVVCAVIVDVVRLLVYGMGFSTGGVAGLRGQIVALALTGTAAAFIGSYLGARLLKKITVNAVRNIVGVALMLLGLAMGTGVV
jgi:uncharacterized membrane protein YfcA